MPEFELANFLEVYEIALSGDAVKASERGVLVLVPVCSSSTSRRSLPHRPPYALG
jgi:hypothetical protein